MIRRGSPERAFVPPSGFTSGLSECSNPPTRFWKGVPMLHRTFFVLPLLFLLLACDAVSANPSTSAPRTRDLGEYTRACGERMDAINEWELKQERNIEDEWIDGRRGLMQSGAKLGRVEEEAQFMRQELRDNCEAKKPSPEIAAKAFGYPGLHRRRRLAQHPGRIPSRCEQGRREVWRPATMLPRGSHRWLEGRGVGQLRGIRGRMDEVSYPVLHGERKVGGLG